MYVRTPQNSESGLGQPRDWSPSHPQTSSQRQPDRVTSLLARLKQETDPQRKSLIIFDLGYVGSASTHQVKQSIVTELLREMETNTRQVKTAAIRALAQIPLDSAAKPLLKQLRQETNAIKPDIIFALGRIGSASTSTQVKQSIVTELLREMETNVPVKIPVIKALGEIRLKSATEPLLKQLRSWLSTEEFVIQIIAALGEIGDNRAVDLLVIMLEKYKSFIARREAATALGKIRGSKALAALKRRLNQETDASVKAAISKALLPPTQYLNWVFRPFRGRP